MPLGLVGLQPKGPLHQKAPTVGTRLTRRFRMAAAQRNAEAQFALAVAYENGDGVPQDSVTAFNWCTPPHPSLAYACKH